ncbi:MAG: hypothetical protein WBN06_02490 [Lysobacterales bacterium]
MASPEARYLATSAPIQVERLSAKLTHAAPAHGQSHSLDRFLAAQAGFSTGSPSHLLSPCPEHNPPQPMTVPSAGTYPELEG